MKIKINPVDSKLLKTKKLLSENCSTKIGFCPNKRPITWRARQKFNLKDHQNCSQNCAFAKLLENIKNFQETYKNSSGSDISCSCSSKESKCSCWRGYTNLKKTASSLTKNVGKIPLYAIKPLKKFSSDCVLNNSLNKKPASAKHISILYKAPQKKKSHSGLIESLLPRSKVDTYVLQTKVSQKNSQYIVRNFEEGLFSANSKESTEYPSTSTTNNTRRSSLKGSRPGSTEIKVVSFVSEKKSKQKKFKNHSKNCEDDLNIVNIKDSITNEKDIESKNKTVSSQKNISNIYGHKNTDNCNCPDINNLNNTNLNSSLNKNKEKSRPEDKTQEKNKQPTDSSVNNFSSQSVDTRNGNGGVLGKDLPRKNHSQLSNTKEKVDSHCAANETNKSGKKDPKELNPKKEESSSKTQLNSKKQNCASFQTKSEENSTSNTSPESHIGSEQSKNQLNKNTKQFVCKRIAPKPVCAANRSTNSNTVVRPPFDSLQEIKLENQFNTTAGEHLFSNFNELGEVANKSSGTDSPKPDINNKKNSSDIKEVSENLKNPNKLFPNLENCEEYTSSNHSLFKDLHVILENKPNEFAEYSKSIFDSNLPDKVLKYDLNFDSCPQPEFCQCEILNSRELIRKPETNQKFKQKPEDYNYIDNLNLYPELHFKSYQKENLSFVNSSTNPLNEICVNQSNVINSQRKIKKEEHLTNAEKEFAPTRYTTELHNIESDLKLNFLEQTGSEFLEVSFNNSRFSPQISEEDISVFLDNLEKELYLYSCNEDQHFSPEDLKTSWNKQEAETEQELKILCNCVEEDSCVSSTLLEGDIKKRPLSSPVFSQEFNTHKYHTISVENLENRAEIYSNNNTELAPHTTNRGQNKHKLNQNRVTCKSIKKNKSEENITYCSRVCSKSKISPCVEEIKNHSLNSNQIARSKQNYCPGSCAAKRKSCSPRSKSNSNPDNKDSKTKSLGENKTSFPKQSKESERSFSREIQSSKQFESSQPSENRYKFENNSLNAKARKSIENLHAGSSKACRQAPSPRKKSSEHTCYRSGNVSNSFSKDSSQTQNIDSNIKNCRANKNKLSSESQTKHPSIGSDSANLKKSQKNRTSSISDPRRSKDKLNTDSTIRHFEAKSQSPSPVIFKRDHKIQPNTTSNANVNLHKTGLPTFVKHHQSPKSEAIPIQKKHIGRSDRSQKTYIDSTQTSSNFNNNSESCRKTRSRPTRSKDNLYRIANSKDRTFEINRGCPYSSPYSISDRKKRSIGTSSPRVSKDNFYRETSSKTKNFGRNHFNSTRSKFSQKKHPEVLISTEQDSKYPSQLRNLPEGIKNKNRFATKVCSRPHCPAKRRYSTSYRRNTSSLSNSNILRDQKSSRETYPRPDVYPERFGSRISTEHLKRNRINQGTETEKVDSERLRLRILTKISSKSKPKSAPASPRSYNRINQTEFISDIPDYSKTFSQRYFDSKSKDNFDSYRYLNSKRDRGPYFRQQGCPNSCFQKVKFNQGVENFSKIPIPSWRRSNSEIQRTTKLDKQCSANFASTDYSTDNLEDIKHSVSLFNIQRSWENFNKKPKRSWCEELQEQNDTRFKHSDYTNGLYKKPTASSVYDSRPVRTDSYSESNILARPISEYRIERYKSQPLLSRRINNLIRKYETYKINKIDSSYLSEMEKKYIFPTWTPPKPGPGLKKYHQRIDNFICTNNPPVCTCEKGTHKEKYSGTCLCEEEKKKKTRFEEPFDRPTYPIKRPGSHRLSFVDDPPYCNSSDFLSDVNYRKMKLLYSERNNDMSSTSTTRKTNENEYYCRYTLPRWVDRHPDN